MKRAAVEKGRTKKIWMKHLRLNHNWPREKVECRCDLQANRFRKGQKQAGCGQPRCYLCHFEKLMGIPSIRELRMDIKVKEEMK
jgi:hypothetical protein